jgi:hypothetical protein
LHLNPLDESATGKRIVMYAQPWNLELMEHGTSFDLRELSEYDQHPQLDLRGEEGSHGLRSGVLGLGRA